MKLSHAKQIEEALRALLPAPVGHDPEKVRRAIKDAIEAAVKREVPYRQLIRSARSKEGKRRLTSYRRVAELSRKLLRARFDALSPLDKKYLVHTLTALDHPIEIADALLYSPPAGRQRSRKHCLATTDLVRESVRTAYLLLVWCGHVPSVTAEGRWERLTRALAGDDEIEVRDHLRTLKKDAPRIASVLVERLYAWPRR